MARQPTRIIASGNNPSRGGQANKIGDASRGCGFDDTRGLVSAFAWPPLAKCRVENWMQKAEVLLQIGKKILFNKVVSQKVECKYDVVYLEAHDCGD